MQINNVNSSILASACALLLGLGGIPAASAQTLFDAAPDTCVRIATGGLPSAGLVTKITEENEHVAVAEGEAFVGSPELVYTAPDTSGLYTLGYEVVDTAPAGSGVGTCSFDGAACGPPFNVTGNVDCPGGSNVCFETIVLGCAAGPVLDTATVTFNISDFDPCPSVGRGGGCGPDVPQ